MIPLREEIWKVLENDEIRLKISMELLKEFGIFDLYERMIFLFGVLFDQMQTEYDQRGIQPLYDLKADKPDWGGVLQLMMALSARHQLIFATGHLLRGQLIEAPMHVRRAIEAAGIAYLCKSQPDLADVYFANDREEFRRRTSSGKILPKNNPLTADLHEIYDQANELTHNNIRSLADRLKPSLSQDQMILEFAYCDTDPPTYRKFKQFTIWTLGAGIRIVQLLGATYDLTDSVWHQTLEEIQNDYTEACVRLNVLMKPLESDSDKVQ